MSHPTQPAPATDTGDSSTTESPTAPRTSPVERAKLASRQLRGDITETLDDASQAAFAKDDVQVLKFHGVYQQDDRDLRTQRRSQGLDKAWGFMVRVGPPGGRLSAAQYLAMDELAGRHADGSLRLTSRQGIQFHGVGKDDLRSTIGSVQDALLTTFGACGDVPRNIIAPATPLVRQPSRLVQELATAMARELKPRTRAHWEIWGRDREGARQRLDPAAEEPFFGSSYLPRKFKIALALSDDNSVDVFTHDLGFIGLVVQHDGEERVEDFVLVAGGGLGLTHGRGETIARMATPLGVVPAKRVIEAARAVVSLHRDLGDRENRRHARLKYLLEDLGPEHFRTLLEERLGAPLDPAKDPVSEDFADGNGLLQQHHLGIHPQGDGRYFLGVPLEAGRIRDRSGGPGTRAAFAEIASRLEPEIRITPMQGLIFAGLDREQAETAVAILRSHGVAEPDRTTPLRSLAMACPALPTCGLALAESERVQEDVLTSLELILEELDLDQRPLVVRMTGCPNGCARPYNADIGLVGRRPGHYHVYLGGNPRGDSLGDLHAEAVPLAEIAPVLRPELERWKVEGLERESFGDFYRRRHHRERRTLLTGREEPRASGGRAP